MHILILNGPNLNRLGKREPNIYGNESISDVVTQLEAQFPQCTFLSQHSNIEGELINYLQAAEENPEISGIVFNAAAYSHTSIALADCIKALSKRVVLVHISNIYDRETERHTDLLLASAYGCITGFGIKGYALGVQALLN